MQIAVVILLIVIAALIAKREFGLRVLAANPDEWLVLEWSKLSDASETESRSRGNQTSLHIRFIPIIGWTYKYGKIDVIIPPAYRQIYLPLKAENYKAVSYWIRDDAVFDISDYSSHAGDLWENLSNQALMGTKIQIDGGVPRSFRKRLSEILAIGDERQDKERI
ncbi:MAG TPA: hypothetical protein VKF36_14325 [Syntrophorhabdales bacterium]|nr:hypothetical protein [Syntrophorhabdales bacterium]